jgi:hypothetical protein
MQLLLPDGGSDAKLAILYIQSSSADCFLYCCCYSGRSCRQLSIPSIVHRITAATA